MADVQPLRALHYDLDGVGSLQDRGRPAVRRDRPRAARRAGRALALQRRRDRPARGAGGDPYAAAARLLERWQADGAVVRDDEPAIWALVQDYTGPDGRALHPPRHLRARARRGVRPGPDPPARAHAPRPARRTGCASRARRRPTCRRSSASTTTRPARRGARSSRTTTAEPFGEATDDDGTRQPPLARRRPGARSRRVQAALGDAELLIADGHHRYETARVYADEIGGEGEHRYVLMCLVALQDAGPHGLPHPPPARRTSTTRTRRRRSATRCASTSTSSRSSTRELRAAGRRPGRSRWATSTPTSQQRLPPDAQGPGDRRRRARGLPRALPPPRHRRCSRR